MQTLAALVFVAVVLTAFVRATTALARRGHPATEPGTGGLVFRYSPWRRVANLVLGKQ